MEPPLDPADQADITIEQTLNAGLAKLHAAASGHGQAVCADCGEPIPAARRQAFPAAIRCIECQEIFERFQHTGEARRATLNAREGTPHRAGLSAINGKVWKP
ncbi:TraR/DksA family transcriptional regulator [Cardiobacterium valvarum]|uniref:DnaK suppressor protein n=1 Tax=Cardiobacterium valvarum TaxID=194702 RepID=A0A381E3Y2_9GAMM|nr:TraR/DksA family transcriptional regulator [Cardiobacterium valvarum]SUX20739.1 DnaK suppressor protein [Cardiobacterium valvarum]